MSCSLLLPALVLLTQEPSPPAAVVAFVINQAPVDRTAIALASVPIARGSLPAPAATNGREPVLAVDVVDEAGMTTVAPGLPLLRWPDGSVAVLQVHAAVAAKARGSARVRMTPQQKADAVAASIVPAAHRCLVPDKLPCWTEVLDAWGRVYRAELVPDPSAGADGVLFDTGAARLRRFRSVHRGETGDVAGRPFLGLRAWLLTFHGERRAELTVVLDNDDLPGGPLGAVRLQGFRLCTATGLLRFLPAFAADYLLPPPEPVEGGGHRQWLLRSDSSHYLGDGTGKAFRFHLFADGDDATETERETARWASVRMVVLPQLDAVRQGGAFGAHGGPAPVGDGDGDVGFVGNQVLAWRRAARLGPFGGFGDPENGGLPGAPRHGDSMLHNVLRWRSAELLQIAEAMVLQHPLRPTAGRRERAPADMTEHRRGLGPLAQAAPHGFTAPSYEHASAHLLFDYYWLTGDPLARDELGRLGRGIEVLLASVPFRTSRGEGCCLEAGVLCARATGDAAMLQRLVAHAREVTLPALAPAGAAVALPQPPHPEVLDGQTSFDACWQMAMLVRGLAALHRATDAADCGAAAVRVAVAMAGPCWLEGQGPKTFISATDPSRYSLAAQPADRAAFDRMTIGAFVLAAELAGDPAVAARLWTRAKTLLDQHVPVASSLPERLQAAANPWLQVAMDRQRTQ